MVINDYSRIMECLLVFFPFQNRRNDHHIMLASQLFQQLSGLSFQRLRKLYPRIAFTGAHKKWSSPDLL
jgi:hypothetical protein